VGTEHFEQWGFDDHDDGIEGVDEEIEQKIEEYLKATYPDYSEDLPPPRKEEKR
jgi:hypothetical protein